jgi:hypothetical protein
LMTWWPCAAAYASREKAKKEQVENILMTEYHN